MHFQQSKGRRNASVQGNGESCAVIMNTILATQVPENEQSMVQEKIRA